MSDFQRHGVVFKGVYFVDSFTTDSQQIQDKQFAEVMRRAANNATAAFITAFAINSSLYASAFRRPNWSIQDRGVLNRLPG